MQFTTHDNLLLTNKLSQSDLILNGYTIGMLASKQTHPSRFHLNYTMSANVRESVNQTKKRPARLSFESRVLIAYTKVSFN